MKKSFDASILIPTLNPDETLLSLIDGINKHLSSMKQKLELKILIVDDGSFLKKSLEVLDTIAKNSTCTILKHDVNLGKGAALKTGMQYLQLKKISYVVTADGDGQHLVADIFKILMKAISSDMFVLGHRSFLKSNKVPLKSRIGNSITSNVLFVLSGNRLEDTQSGLRAFPSRFISELLLIKGERYDYEFNQLIHILSKKALIEVPIETVYIDKNSKTHFRPLADSLLIYFVFIRYFAVALTVSCIDFLMIYVSVALFSTTYSFLVVRLFTLHIYFLLMRKTVFKSSSNWVKQLCIYYIFSILNALVSWNIFDKFFFEKDYNFLISYFLSLILLFFVNFLIQKTVIFK